MIGIKKILIVAGISTAFVIVMDQVGVTAWLYRKV